MAAKQRIVELQGVRPKRIVAISGNHHYLWNEGAPETIWDEQWSQYVKENPSAQCTVLCGVCADYDTDNAYLFYVADCFSPPVYLVFGRTEQDAFDTFVTEFEELVKIEDSDLADYGDNYSVNDNGTPVDTLGVQSMSVSELRLTVANKPA